MESEELFERPARARPGSWQWLGLCAARRARFPPPTTRPGPDPRKTRWSTSSRRHFAPYNEDLFDLLGRRLWERVTLRSPCGARLGRRPHGLDRHGCARSSARAPGRPGARASRARPPPAPPGPAAAAAAGSRAGGRRGRPPPARRAARRGRPGARRRRRTVAAGHAQRGGLDHELGLGHIGRPTPPARPRPASAAAVSARAAVRFTTTTSAAPASARASVTARAAPPAPITTTALGRRGRTPRRVAGRPGTLPVGGVTRPASPSRQRDAVDRAQPAGHRGARRRPAAKACLLVGHGHRQPGDPQGPHPGEGGGGRPGRHGERHRHPVEARARRRRRCAAAGDSEWAMGSPITPTTVEAAVGHVGRSSGAAPVPTGTAAHPRPRLWARRSLACWPAKVSEKASVPSLDTTTKYSQSPAWVPGRPAATPWTGSRWAWG